MSKPNYKFDPNFQLQPGQKHILLAEDGEIQARILSATFEKAGFKMSWVEDGVQAYEAIKNGFTPDLLITDVMMPGMSGFELLTRLKNENILPPTIVLTGLQKEEEVLRGLECGALDYIKKPFSPSVILAKVQMFLNRKAA